MIEIKIKIFNYWHQTILMIFFFFILYDVHEKCYFNIITGYFIFIFNYKTLLIIKNINFVLIKKYLVSLIRFIRSKRIKTINNGNDES